MKTETKKTLWQRLHQSRLFLYIACVFIAIIVWLIIMSIATPKYAYTYHDVAVSSISLTEDEADQTAPYTLDYPKEIDLLVRASKTDRATYDADDITVYFNTAEVIALGEGEHKIWVSVSYPEGSTMENDPLSLSITVSFP